MAAFRQDIRFARTSDGARVAYAVSGRGYPLIRGATWLTNIEIDWQTPVLGPYISALSERYRLIRYNPRSYGTAGGEAEISLETHYADLAAVVEAAGFERVALYGASAGAFSAIAFAARHPERVSHLVLHGGFARGALRRNPLPENRERVLAMAKLMELGWDEANPAFRQMMTTQFFPSATPEQIRSFNDMQRWAVSGPQVARVFLANASVDVSDLLEHIRCPTLVLHSQGDLRIPFAEARLMAASIPNAHFVPLESDNHLPLQGEPAFERLFQALEAFLPVARNADPHEAAFEQLSPRERQVLDLIARGRDNAQIAALLALSRSTVRNHITAIFDKLAVESRAQAIVRAREAGMGQ